MGRLRRCAFQYHEYVIVFFRFKPFNNILMHGCIFNIPCAIDTAARHLVAAQHCKAKAVVQIILLERIAFYNHRRIVGIAGFNRYILLHLFQQRVNRILSVRLIPVDRRDQVIHRCRSVCHNLRTYQYIRNQCVLQRFISRGGIQQRVRIYKFRYDGIRKRKHQVECQRVVYQ